MKVCRCRQLEQAAVAEREPREQIQRERGHPNPSRHAGDNGQTQDHRPELDQQEVVARVHAA